MTVATLDTIESALLAALAPLGPAPGGDATFKSLDRWAGELTSGAALDRDALLKLPAAALAWAGEEPDVRAGLRTLALGTAQTVGRSTWVVYLAVSDPRGDARALKGQSGLPGLLARIQAVVSQLAGLTIAGLYDRGAVEYLGARAVRVEPGFYLYAVRFATERVIAPLAKPDASGALSGVLVHANLAADGATGFVNPLDTFTAP